MPWGRRYLASEDKYFLTDPAFRYARLGTRNLNVGHMHENIVAVELRRLGFEVYGGTLYQKEIDFVAIRQSSKVYIQVSDNIASAETFQRKVKSLLSIRDGYPRLLLARTRQSEYQHEGIRVIDLAEWLSCPEDFLQLHPLTRATID